MREANRVLDRCYRPEPFPNDHFRIEYLVALNAERAREESQGIIRWLRPEYQERGQRKLTLPGTGDDSTPAKRKPAKRTSKAKQAWPGPLAERVKVVESALHAAGGPVTPEALTQQFARAKPADVNEILETLVTLGRARKAKDGEGYQA